MKRNIIPYNRDLTEKARRLRNHSTVTEIKLWKFLRRKQMSGYDFHRQKPVGRYIVDFYCSELNLAIEIDGMSHIGRDKYDKQRQKELEALGVRFIRLADDDVFYNIGKVLTVIEKWIEENGGQD